MFVVLSYDIKKKRVAKVMKICRKYLVHIHKSVFEGNISEAKLKRLKNELERVIKTIEDSICIYEMESLKFTHKEQSGVVEEFSQIL